MPVLVEEKKSGKSSKEEQAEVVNNIFDLAAKSVGDKAPTLVKVDDKFIHGLNDPITEAINLEDRSVYVGAKDRSGKLTTGLCVGCGGAVHVKAGKCPYCKISKPLEGLKKWTMVSCAECKNTYPSTFKVCPVCGHDKAKPIKQVKCSQCSLIFSEDIEVCPNCGSKTAFEVK